MIPFIVTFFIISFSPFLIILIHQYGGFKRERIRISQISRKHKVISKRVTKKMVKYHENELCKRINVFSEQFHSRYMSPLGLMLWKLRYTQALSFIGKMSNARILDVGCGDGILTLYATEMGLKSIGLEISGARLRKAKDRFRNKERSFLGVVADATHLPFKEESFSSIFCLDVLEHIPDGDNCLKEMYRVLERDGNAIITTPCATAMDIINVFEFLYKLRAIVTWDTLPRERLLCSDHGWLKNKFGLKVKKAPYIFHRDFIPYELKKKCEISGFYITRFHTYNYITVNRIISKMYNIIRSLSLSKSIIMCLTRLLSVFPHVKYLGKESIIICDKSKQEP